jgi:hypothetical protein
MNPEDPHTDDGHPTEEIYLELRELESAAANAERPRAEQEPAPVVADDDDPTGIKARIARLRAVLSDRGVEPPNPS